MLHYASKPKITKTADFTGIVDSVHVNLDDYFDVVFKDSTGKDVDYIWEATEDKRKGICFDDDNNVYFTKPGTFHIRAVDPNNRSLYSNEIEISAIVHGDDWEPPVDEAPELVEADENTTFVIDGSYNGLVGAEPDAIEGQTAYVIDGQTAYVIDTSDDGTVLYGHGRLEISAYDGTGKEISTAYTWEAQEADGITITKDGKVSFTQPGVYHVRVNSGAYHSNWFVINAANQSEEYSTLTFTDADDSLIEKIVQPWGSAFTAPEPAAKEGFVFAGWSVPVPETMPADSMTIQAQWKVDDAPERVLLIGETEGLGQIKGSDDGSEPAFDDEHPMQSLYYNTVKGESVIFSAKADEDWEFTGWKNNETGETYSTDATITLKADEPLSLVAVFKPTNVPEAFTPIASAEDILNWVKVDYEKKTGVAAYPEYVSRSDEAYVVEVKDKDGKVLDTYTIDPKTGVGTNTASAEVNLPQTGVTSRTAAMAVGGAVSLVAVGAWLMRKAFRKKEDEE